jgi:hypothetical protein
VRRASLALCLAALAAASLAPPARAADFLGCEPGAHAFGLCSFDLRFAERDGQPATQAGSHPFKMTTSFGVNYSGEEKGHYFVEGGDIKDLLLTQARGLVGDATAVPRCAATEFLSYHGAYTDCPPDTVVGATAAVLPEPLATDAVPAAVYNLAPPPGVAVRLGFITANVPLVIDVGVKPGADYNVVAAVRDIPQPLTVFGAVTELWGVPADPAHDFARGECLGSAAEKPKGFGTLIAHGELNLEEGGPTCPAEAPSQKPLLTLPRTCEAPLATAWEADPWSEPGAFLGGSVLVHDFASPPAPQPFRGCGKLSFEPSIESRPSADAAATGSGLDFQLSFEDPVDPGRSGLVEPEGLAGSDLKKAVIALPEGMTVNPSIAEGLGVCTPADLDRETLAAAPGQGCPSASKIGAVSVSTPLVEEPIAGNVFVAQPDDPATAAPGAENPFDTLIAFYIVLKNPKLGVLFKVPAKVEPDPRTGQLLTTVDDAPQWPFERFDFHFREGLRPPLITPPGCGSFRTEARLTPWARPGETVVRAATFAIGRGPGGGPCPAGAAPFHPTFQAGSLDNAAGHYSPFYLRLARKDGEGDIGRLSFVLPPGVVPNLTGIPYCPEAAIAAAAARSGRAELAAPSCPAASRIGATLAGAGVGASLTYVPGRLYLGGPYHGDPLSAVAITPAVAGPFDAGVVVVREALRLNPVTYRGEVDGAASDPIPHILRGIPLSVRDLRVLADRPRFTLDPTSCEPFGTLATVWGQGTALAPAPESPVGLSARYQAADCAALGFKPRLGLRLRGGTRRGRFPALRAVYAPRPGDANLARLALAFPRSEFIEQGHFATICTRAQFAAGPGGGADCPAGSAYGHVKAWSPLLDEPLQGPVYLRSSSHNLPDAVLALRGIVDLDVAVRIDSVHGRLRATVEGAPDAPVSRAIVDMQGGRKGLFVNSTNLCGASHRARARLAGHNAKRHAANPRMRARCAKGKGKGRRGRHG